MPSGAVLISSGVLPPPDKKWNNFRDLTSTVGRRKVHRLSLSLNGRKFVPLTPADVLKLPQHAQWRPRVLLVGGAVSGASVYVSQLTPFNAAKSILVRMLRTPVHSAVPEPFLAASRLLFHLFPAEFFWPITADTPDEWLEHFPPERQAVFRRIRAEFDLVGFSKKWLRFKSFLKSEKLPGFRKGGGFLAPAEGIVDRPIQGPSDFAHWIAGPIMRPATARLKQCWGPTFPIFYAACSPEKLDAWFNENYIPGTWGLASDFSSYDHSHTELSWGFIEEQIYKRLGLFSLDPRLREVLRGWRCPAGTMTGLGFAVRYAAYLMMASGRDDTALANAILNGVATALSLACLFSGKDFVTLLPSDLLSTFNVVSISICGDDSLVLIRAPLPLSPAAFTTALSGLYAQFGLDAAGDKMVLTQDPFRFVYLGQRPHPVPNTDRWTFGRTIGRAIWKLGWRLDGRPSDQVAWQRGVMDQVVRTQRIVPILCDLAQNYLDCTTGPIRVQLTGVEARELLHKPWFARTEPTPPYDQRVVDYLATGYGVDVREFQNCIGYCRILRPYPCVLDHPVLTRCIEVDDL